MINHDEYAAMMADIATRQNELDSKLDDIQKALFKILEEQTRWKTVAGVLMWLLAALWSAAIAFKDELIRFFRS